MKNIPTFLEVPRGCLQFVIVVFPDHTHLLFLKTHSYMTTVLFPDNFEPPLQAGNQILLSDNTCTVQSVLTLASTADNICKQLGPGDETKSASED